MTESFLYVIADSKDGPVKLGVSKHPAKRVCELQTGHSRPLLLFHTEPIEKAKARIYETLLHRDIRHHRLRGEWFNLSVEAAIKHLIFTFIEYDLVDDIHSKRKKRLI